MCLHIRRKSENPLLKNGADEMIKWFYEMEFR